ncbi:MAG TPA: hypothetical protein VLK83_00960 [Rhodanobacteraceae bacterium]|nr:hypothetical protein [Rhodanobacteraceae bacterium]
MLDALRWIGYLLIALIVFVVSVFAAYRLRGPSRAQRDAIELLQKDYRPAQGSNAFPLLWFMSYDVPEGELDARMTSDVAAVSDGLVAGKVMATYTPAAARLSEAAGDPSRLCDSGPANCLAKVTADPQAMRSTLATYPVMRAREKSFEKTDFYWNDFPADFRAALAAHPGDAQRVWLSAFALEYVEGNRGAALADVCRNIGTWRRLRHGTNSLIGAMIAIRNADGAVRLLAQMLAASPADQEIPEECDIALRPIEAADVDRCGEMAGEFAFAQSTPTFSAQANVSWWERAQAWMMFDSRQSNGWRAEQYANYCSEAATVRMLADVPLSADTLPQITHRAECVASAVGCMLADIASPLYVDYDARTLDFAAHLRLAATLLWLRESPTQEPLAQRFEQRPAALRSGQRRSGIDPATGMLFVDNLYRPGEPFELPVASP